MAKYISCKSDKINIQEDTCRIPDSNIRSNETELNEEVIDENRYVSERTHTYANEINDIDKFYAPQNSLTHRSNLHELTDEDITRLIEYAESTSPNNWYMLRIRMADIKDGDSMEEKFMCYLCKCILYNPVQLEECGHRLCNKCWLSFLETRDTPKCPRDNYVVNQDRVFIDTAFQIETGNLKVYCPQNVNLSSTKEGCLWEGSLNDCMEHFKSCPWRPITCPRECGHSIEFQNIRDHINQKCRITWRQCGFCKMQVIVSELAEHENSNCPEIPISCHNNCGIVKSLPRKLMMDHQKYNCPLEPRVCPFITFGCKIKGNEEEIKTHLKRKAIPHLGLLAEGLSGDSNTLKQSVKTLLDEKARCSVLERKLGNLEKLWGSQLVWKVEKFFNKFTDAKSGIINTYFSPTFLSSPCGYKLALGLCPYGDGVAKGKYLSIFVCICRGEYDNLLQWPFPLKVTFSLLDQAPKLQDRNDVVYSFVPNIVKDNLPFLGKPQGERNPFFGARKLISLESLMEHGTYTLNETIFFKVNIQEK